MRATLHLTYKIDSFRYLCFGVKRNQSEEARRAHWCLDKEVFAHAMGNTIVYLGEYECRGINEDGSGYEIVARGIRNTVGFDWDPMTKELWFTENGRDWLGDHQPPDELNHAPTTGMDFGYPYCHGHPFQIRNMGRNIPVVTSGPRWSIWTLTSPPWGCASTQALCFRQNIAIKFSSQNMVRGIEVRKSGTASRWHCGIRKNDSGIHSLLKGASRNRSMGPPSRRPCHARRGTVSV
jgi:hypothetical protein